MKYCEECNKELEDFEDDLCEDCKSNLAASILLTDEFGIDEEELL